MKRLDKLLKKEPIEIIKKEQTYTFVIYCLGIWWVTAWVWSYNISLEEVNYCIEKIKSKEKRITIWNWTYKTDSITAYKVKEYQPSDR